MARQKNPKDPSVTSKAQFILGEYYYKKENYSQSYDWLKKAATVIGNYKALFYLGQFRLTGTGGIEIDTNLGLKYITKAANEGYLEAKFFLVEIYLTGLYGVTNDSGKAEELFDEIAASKNLGEFDIGRLKQKAMQEDPNAFPVTEKAQFILGKYYHEERDYRQSYYWYEMSAQRGNLRALFYLGLFHLTDTEGIKKDTVLGLGYITSAADGGDLQAKFTLADIYQNGLHGLPIDLEKAKELLIGIAALGNEIVFLKIGRLCESRGDREGAIEWYQKAKNSRIQTVCEDAENAIARLELGGAFFEVNLNRP